MKTPHATAISSLSEKRAAVEALFRPAAGGRVVLRLYIAGSTAQSARAVHNSKRICEALLEGRYELTVVDLYAHPEKAADEQVLCTPTLVRQSPAPVRRLIGDLSDVRRLQRATLLDLMRAARSGRSRVEIISRSADGTPAPLQLGSSPVSRDPQGTLCLVATDLTAIKRHDAELRRLHEELEQRVVQRTAQLAETLEALRLSEQKFRQMAENIHDVFWMTAPGFERVLYVSPAYEKIWGRTCESLYANPRQWIEAILPEDRSAALATLGLLGISQPTAVVEFRIARPDGSIRWVLDRGFQVTDGTGNVVCNTGVVTDITARKEAEKALQQLHQQLLESSRRAGMAEIATNVLHNVGNVLNSVDVSAELAIASIRNSKASSLSKIVTLLQQHESDLATFLTQDRRGHQIPLYLSQLARELLGDQKRTEEWLASLRSHVQHIKQIVAAQQSYAAMSQGRETLKLADVIEDCVRIQFASFQACGVELIRELQDLPPAPFERNKIMLVLLNLLCNSILACNEAAGARKQVTLRLAGDLTSVQFWVTDNGVGIAPENLSRIFSHGFTTRKDGHGFGLHGSALAAQEMGGALHAHSAGQGLGATFVLVLPWPQTDSR